jgi:hypothetical protein
VEVAVSPCLIDTPNVDKGALPFTDAYIQRLDLRIHPDRVKRMVTLFKEKITNRQSTVGAEFNKERQERSGHIFPGQKIACLCPTNTLLIYTGFDLFDPL